MVVWAQLTQPTGIGRAFNSRSGRWQAWVFHWLRFCHYFPETALQNSSDHLREINHGWRKTVRNRVGTDQI